MFFLIIYFSKEKNEKSVLLRIYRVEKEMEGKMERVKEWLEQNWRIAICGGIGGSVLFLSVLGIVYLSRNQTNEEEKNTEEWVFQEEEPTDIDEEEQEEVLPFSEQIMVDIKGGVNVPGVYELKEGDRLLDVVELAGGLVSEADSQRINLAQRLTDQMMIYIPLEGEEITEEILLLEEAEEENSQDSSIININTADENQLTQLNGIGEKRARTIIEYREENGLFGSEEEIMNVSGIGEGIYANIKDDIRVKE